MNFILSLEKESVLNINKASGFCNLLKQLSKFLILFKKKLE
jgi:hypothetical protein